MPLNQKCNQMNARTSVMIQHILTFKVSNIGALHNTLLIPTCWCW